MEGHCSTGQSPQWAVVPMGEEEEEEEEKEEKKKEKKKNKRRRRKKKKEEKKKKKNIVFNFTKNFRCAKYLLHTLCMCELRKNTSTPYLNTEIKKFVIAAVKTSKTCGP